MFLFNVASFKLNICFSGTEKEILPILPVGIWTLWATIVVVPSKLKFISPFIFVIIPVCSYSLLSSTGFILFRFISGGMHISPMIVRPIKAIIVQKKRLLCLDFIFILFPLYFDYSVLYLYL